MILSILSGRIKAATGDNGEISGVEARARTDVMTEGAYDLPRAIRRVVSLTTNARKYFRRDDEDAAERSGELLLHDWYIAKFMHRDATREQALTHYRSYWRSGRVRPNPAFDPAFVTRNLALAETVDPLTFAGRNPERVDYTCEWFSRQQYLKLYPDVLQSWGTAPELHFLKFGLAEGRQPNPDFYVRQTPGIRKPAIPATGTDVDRFEWNGKSFEVTRNVISPDIIAQIRDQASHEIALLAPGADAIPNLRKYMATDLFARGGLDVFSLIEKAGHACDVAVFVPSIAIGSRDKYITDLIQEVHAVGGARVLVIVTACSEVEARKCQGHPDVAGLFSSRLLFWQDLPWDRTQEAWYAALLMNRLQPRYIFVIDSDLGYQLLSLYGRALSSFAACLAFYFDEPPAATGAPGSARYFTEAYLHSVAVTDNEVMTAKLRYRAAGQANDRIMTLPPRVDVEPEIQFEARLRARFGPEWQAMRSNCCAVLAGPDACIAIQVLLEIARHLPDLTVDLFGSVPDDAHTLIAAAPGLRDRGQSVRPETQDFASYGFLLLPASFAGVRDMVLQAAQTGLPVVTTDIGALRETFDDRQLFFVPPASDPAGTAAGFVSAISALQSLRLSELETRARAARAAVVTRHGPAAFSAVLTKLLRAG